MGQALQAADQVGAVGAEVEGVGVADGQVAAHARGEVDDHVGVGGPHPLDCGPVKLHVAGAAAGGRVPDVDVDDGRPGLGRLQGGGGDLLGGDGQVRVLVGGVARPGNGAGDDHIAVHPRNFSFPRPAP